MTGWKYNLNALLVHDPSSIAVYYNVYEVLRKHLTGLWNIESETKWQPFRRQNLHFLLCKWLHFVRNFTEISSKGSTMNNKTTLIWHWIGPEHATAIVENNSWCLLTHIWVIQFPCINENCALCSSSMPYGVTRPHWVGSLNMIHGVC